MHPLLQSKGHKPRRGTVRQCLYCGVDVYLPPCRIGLYKTTFCSKVHNILQMKKDAFSFTCTICSKVVHTQPAQMKYRHRKTCSLKCRGKYKRVQAEFRRKTSGYTKHQLDRLARYSPEAEEWRTGIFKRDDYTCKMCGVRGGYLEADHIKPWAYFPTLRFDLSNGRTLCRGCHNTTKVGYKKMRELYVKA